MQKQESQNNTVCIIGAGIGGLTAGALLSKQGYQVTIFEKESLLGGRALSFDASTYTLDQYIQLLSKYHMHVSFSEPDLATIFKQNMLNGYMLDLGYHTIGGGVLSNLNSVLASLGDHLETLESNVGFIKEQGYDFPFLSRLDKLKIFPNIFRLLFASEATMSKLDNVSITKTIEHYGRGKMKIILEIFSRSISTINNLDHISTGEMFRAQRTLLRGSKPVGYPKNGLSCIHQKLAHAITSNGGHIYLSTPVQEILFDNNRVIGVRVGGTNHLFDFVISTILVQELFTIADEQYFPKEYVKNLRSLKGTASLCAYYSLQQVPPELVGKTFHFIERGIGVDGNDAVGMIDFMSTCPEAGLSPPSQYLVQSYIICTPEEAKNKKTLTILKNALDTNLNHLIPDYQKILRWTIYPAITHLDGVAKTIDNTKPDIRTPIDRFYLIGDCVKAPGIGINCAINSARIVKDIIVSSK